MCKLYIVWFLDETGAELGKSIIAENKDKAIHEFQEIMFRMKRRYITILKVTELEMKNEGF